MDTGPDELSRLVDRVPVGYSDVLVGEQRWGLTREDRADGASVTIYAEQLGGAGTVSANVYRTTTGDVLRPCEMPATTVLAFLRGWRPAPRDP